MIYYWNYDTFAWGMETIDSWGSVPTETTNECDCHGGLCESRLRGVEEIQGEILTRPLMSKPTKDLIVPYVTGLFKNSPDFR